MCICSYYLSYNMHVAVKVNPQHAASRRRVHLRQPNSSGVNTRHLCGARGEVGRG